MRLAAGICTALGLALVLIACSGNDEIVPDDAQATVDAAVDAPSDATADSAIDAPTDAAPVQGCIAVPAVVQVREDGSAMVGITLQLPPATSIDVAFAVENTSWAAVTPAMLTFTAADYATPKMISVSGINDVDVFPKETNVSCTVPGATPTLIPVHVEDITDPALETSTTSMNIFEYSTGMFGVRMTAEPPSSVTVTIESLDVGAATVSPATLTITPTNWNSYQQVTVSGVQDADILEEMVTVRLSATPFVTRTVTVRVTDDD